MVADAQAHSDEDKKKREATEARNQADTLIYTTEKTLKENRDKLGDAEAADAEKALEAARKAVQDGDKEAIQKALADLTRASHKMAEVLYQKAAPPPPGAGGGGDGSAGDKGDGGDVIDAEVVDKK